MIQLGRPPATRDELWQTVKTLFGVVIPRTQVCPDHVAPFTAFADAYFGECSILRDDSGHLLPPIASSRAIWHASRGLAGKCGHIDRPILLADGTRTTWGELVGLTVEVLTPGGPAKATFTDNGIETIYRITFDSGITADVTGHHKFLAADRNVHRKQPDPKPIGFTDADRLAPGVLVATSAHLETLGSRAIPDGRIIATALMIGDGSMTANNLALSQEDAEVTQWFTDAVESLGDHVRHSTQNNHLVSGGHLRAMIRDDGLNVRSEHKHIPDWVFEMTPSGRLLFLRGLFATDAEMKVRPRKLEVTYFSSSERLVRDVQLLAWTLGVPGRISRKTGRGYKNPQGAKVACLDSWEWRPLGGQVDHLVELFGYVPGRSQFFEAYKSFERHGTPHSWRTRNAGDGEFWDEVVSVDLLPAAPTVCISVDSADHEFSTPHVEHNSLTLSTLGLTFAYLRGADITILGGSMAQSTNVFEYMKRAMDYKNVPDDMTVDQTATRVQLTNKGRVRPLPASQRNIRGPHPSVLLMDEVDEMELAIYDGALGQPMPQPNYLGEIVDTYTVMSSTWQYSDGTLTEIFRRAETNGDVTYRWCFLESANPIDGWLSSRTIEEKRRSISKQMWETEYELNEPSIGNRAFDTAAVDRAFCLPFAPIASKEAKDFDEYTFVEPVRGATYVAGADWGRERDYTAIMVGRVDVVPHELVYYMRVNRRPYPEMIGYFNKAINRYGARAAHDATGLGNVVNDYTDVRAERFIMTGEKRSGMLSAYVSDIENGKWIFPKIKKLYEEMKFAQVGDLYSSASTFHLPDTVCAGGLMNRMADRAGGMVAPESIKRDGTPSKMSAFLDGKQDTSQGSLADQGVPATGISLLV